MIAEKIKKSIREIPDFPKPGISFKDITPILQDPNLVEEIVLAFIEQIDFEVDVICAVESRGFFFGLLLANRLKLPFVPIRKEGKLPGDTVNYSYSLEYGTATVEIQQGSIKKGQRVLIHDDLLATGGTIHASAQLVKSQGGIVSGLSFLVALNFLEGMEKIKPFTKNIISLVEY